MTVRKVANGNPTPTRLYVAISGLAKLTAVDGQEGRSVCPCERIERLPELMEYLAERNPEKNKTTIKRTVEEMNKNWDPMEKMEDYVRWKLPAMVATSRSTINHVHPEGRNPSLFFCLF
jgi:hypothetical protein